MAMCLADRVRGGAGGGDSCARWLDLSERCGLAGGGDGVRGGGAHEARAGVVDCAAVAGLVAVVARGGDLVRVWDVALLSVAGGLAFGAFGVALSCDGC